MKQIHYFIFSLASCFLYLGANAQTATSHTILEDELGYILVSPPDDGGDETYPIILALHGGGTMGDPDPPEDSVVDPWDYPQMRFEYIEAFSDLYPENPHYLIVPRTNSRRFWEIPEQLESIIQDVADENPDADLDRVILMGYSMGGRGVLRLIERQVYPCAIIFTSPVWAGMVDYDYSTASQTDLLYFASTTDTTFPLMRRPAGRWEGTFPTFSRFWNARFKDRVCTGCTTLIRTLGFGEEYHFPDNPADVVRASNRLEMKIVGGPSHTQMREWPIRVHRDKFVDFIRNHM